MRLEEGDIKRVSEVLIKNRDNDFFNCVTITGTVRLGKSNLAHQIAKAVYPEFTYEQNYIGNPKHAETWKKLKYGEKGSLFWLDEAAKVLSAERRFDKEQWYLQQLFNQFAYDRKTILLCTPTFLEIDPRWRRTHITLWVHLFKRGKGVIMKNRFIQSDLDTWGLRNMKEKEMAMRADEQSDERILANYDANPCSLFFFTFKDWAEEEKIEYMKHKEQSHIQFEKEFSKWEKLNEFMTSVGGRAEIGIARIAAYMLSEYSIPYQEVAVLSGYSETKIRESLDSFIQAVHDETIEKSSLPKKYYDEKFYQFVEDRINTKAKI
jgi:hypothetical protein